MSYLSMLKPEIREHKAQQLKRALDTKPELFRNLNLTTQKKQFEKSTQDLLNQLPEERRELYEGLYEKFHKAFKIVDIKDIIPHVEVANNNKISFIPLFDNTLGENHYAGVYLDLILNYEVNGNIIPGQTKVLETSSGSGGIACSKVAKELGYECIIALPGGGEKARENAIRDNGAELVLTDSARYTNGFPMFIKRFLIKNKEEIANKKVFFLNHSQGIENKDGTYNNNVYVIQAGSKIGYTILSEFKEKGENLDYFVSGIGNGTNTLGIGGPLHLHGTKIIGFEPFESATAYQRLHPGDYEKKFKINPGELGRHSMPGLTPNDNVIYFPHLENSMDMIEADYLVATKNVAQKYKDKTGESMPDNDVVYYDNTQYDVSEFGRSTKAGFYVALKLAEKVKDQNILFLGYDRGNRYDDYNTNNKLDKNNIHLEKGNFRINSADRVEIDIEGTTMKTNIDHDIIEYITGEKKGEQLFSLQAAKRETGKVGKKLPTEGSMITKLIEEKYNGNIEQFLKQENITPCGCYSDEDHKIYYPSEFVLWCENGEYVYGNNEKCKYKEGYEYAFSSVRCIE